MVLQATRPIALSIAGSDPSGGAGLQADLRTFECLGVHGTTVVSLLTAQSSLGVQSVAPLAPDLVAGQLSELLADLPPRAIKTGALGNSALIEQVARLLSPLKAPLVVDPVLASSRGCDLLAQGGIEALSEHLLPLATLVTPNLPEAAALTGGPVDTMAAIERAAHDLSSMGPGAVLIKGGHGHGEEIADLLLCDGKMTWLSGPRLAGPAPHGTGCVLSAAITAYLATDHGVPQAVSQARAFVQHAIAGAQQLGAGQPFLTLKQHTSLYQDPAR